MPLLFDDFIIHKLNLHELHFPIDVAELLRNGSYSKNNGDLSAASNSGAQEGLADNQGTSAGAKLPTLVILDQFEHLFLAAAEDLRWAFLLSLKTAIENNTIRLVIAIRNDYLDLLMRCCREIDIAQQTLVLKNYYTLQPFNEYQAETVLNGLLQPLKGDLARDQLIDDFNRSLVRDLLRAPQDQRRYFGEEKTILPVELQIVGTIIEDIGPEAFSASELAKQGGKLGLLRLYIEDAKNYVWRQTGATGDLALLALQALRPTELVGSFTAKSVAESIRSSVALTESILRSLAERYLVREVPSKDTSNLPAYELMHEHLVQVLDEIPEPILQRERDARERLKFFVDRERGSQVVDSKGWASSGLKRLFSQSIRVSEAFKLWRFASRPEERQLLRNNIRAFAAKTLLVILGMSIPTVAWIAYIRSDNYQIRRLFADAPVAQTASNTSGSSDIILDWTDAVVRANRVDLVPTIIERVDDEALRVEIFLTAAETSFGNGRADKGREFFDLALSSARNVKNNRTAAAISTVAVAMQRANLTHEADNAFKEAINVGQDGFDVEKEANLSLVLRSLLQADRIDEAMALVSFFKSAGTKDEILEEITHANIRLKNTERALNIALSINNFSSRSAVLAELVKELCKEGKTTEAELLIPKIIQDDFRDEALSELAVGVAQQGRVDDAIRTVRRIRVDDFIPSVQADIVKARQQMKAWPKINAEPEISAADQQTLALAQVAEVLVNSGKKEEGKQLLNKLLTTPVSDPALRTMSNGLIASALLEAGDKDAAERCLHELVEFISVYKMSGDSEEDDQTLTGLFILLPTMIAVADGDTAENQLSAILNGIDKNADEQVKYALLSSMANFLTVALSSFSPNNKWYPSNETVVLATPTPEHLKSEDVAALNRLRSIADRVIDAAFVSASKISDDNARLKAFVTVATFFGRENKSQQATNALEKARTIGISLRSDSEISGAAEMISEGFARVHLFRTARLTADMCSSSDRLKAYAFMLNSYVSPGKESLNLNRGNSQSHLRIPYSGP